MTLYHLVYEIFRRYSEKNPNLEISENRIYSAFYNLKSKSNLLKELDFEMLFGDNPHSIKLEDILSKMGTWEIIFRPGPKYNSIIINPNLLERKDKTSLNVSEKKINYSVEEFEKFIKESQ